MTDQTEAAEVARIVSAQMKDNRWRDLTPLAIAKAVLASDWLAAREAAAEARGAARALREAANTLKWQSLDKGIHVIPPAEVVRWLTARAAATGGGS